MHKKLTVLWRRFLHLGNSRGTSSSVVIFMELERAKPPVLSLGLRKETIGNHSNRTNCWLKPLVDLKPVRAKEAQYNSYLDHCSPREPLGQM